MLVERPTALAEILTALKRISGEQQCAMCKAELKEIATKLEGLGLFLLIEWPRLVGSYTNLADATAARVRKHPDAGIWRAIVEVASDAPTVALQREPTATGDPPCSRCGKDPGPALVGMCCVICGFVRGFKAPT